MKVYIDCFVDGVTDWRVRRVLPEFLKGFEKLLEQRGFEIVGSASAGPEAEGRDCSVESLASQADFIVAFWSGPLIGLSEPAKKAIEKFRVPGFGFIHEDSMDALTKNYPELTRPLFRFYTFRTTDDIVRWTLTVDNIKQAIAEVREEQEVSLLSQPA